MSAEKKENKLTYVNEVLENSTNKENKINKNSIKNLDLNLSTNSSNSNSNS